jgi:hypothetical protein
MSMTQEQINVDLFNRCKQLEAELSTLRAKAIAYDKGREQWQIWDPCHSKIEMVGRTENEAIIAFRKSITYSNPPEPWSQFLAAGYTCRKVRVCKEVDG